MPEEKLKKLNKPLIFNMKIKLDKIHKVKEANGKIYYAFNLWINGYNHGVRKVYAFNLKDLQEKVMIRIQWFKDFKELK